MAFLGPEYAELGSKSWEKATVRKAGSINPPKRPGCPRQRTRYASMLAPGWRVRSCVRQVQQFADGGRVVSVVGLLRQSRP